MGGQMIDSGRFSLLSLVFVCVIRVRVRAND